jgi:hypothetical protein
MDRELAEMKALLEIFSDEATLKDELRKSIKTLFSLKKNI